MAFSGPRYVHGWLRATFADSAAVSLQLVARAKQFGCFVLMIGTLAAADTFEAKYATIVKDKDEFIIPLLVNTIPTPKVRLYGLGVRHTTYDTKYTHIHTQHTHTLIHVPLLPTQTIKYLMIVS